MQLGMIGLGRMGANMTTRLLSGMPWRLKGESKWAEAIGAAAGVVIRKFEAMQVAIRPAGKSGCRL